MVNWKYVPDALNRRVPILPGIFRQQFMGDDLAIGLPRHHIGKRAAAVDPKFPFVLAGVGVVWHCESGQM